MLVFSFLKNYDLLSEVTNISDAPKKTVFSWFNFYLMLNCLYHNSKQLLHISVNTFYII